MNSVESLGCQELVMSYCRAFRGSSVDGYNCIFICWYFLGSKGQIVGRFGLTDCGNVGASFALGDVLVLRIYGLTGLSAGAGEVRRLCCNGP